MQSIRSEIKSPSAHSFKRKRVIHNFHRKKNRFKGTLVLSWAQSQIIVIFKVSLLAVRKARVLTGSSRAVVCPIKKHFGWKDLVSLAGAQSALQCYESWRILLFNLQRWKHLSTITVWTALHSWKSLSAKGKLERKAKYLSVFHKKFSMK